MKARLSKKNLIRPLGSRPKPGARARTEEQKRNVRDDLIAVGRHLFAIEDPSKVSLRKIAAETGYSPGTIYKYFRDQHDLFVAIREQDMSRVVDSLEKIAGQTAKSEDRLRAVLRAATRHWLAHPEEFRVLFAMRPEQSAKEGQTPFGKSEVVTRSYALYRKLIDELFATYPSAPCSSRLATDTLIASTHGVIAFTLHTNTLEWSNPARMVDQVIDALIHSWSQGGR